MPERQPEIKQSLRLFENGAILLGKTMVCSESRYDIPGTVVAQWRDENGKTFYLGSCPPTQDPAVMQYYNTLPFLEPHLRRSESSSVWRIGGVEVKACLWYPGVQAETQNLEYVRANWPGITVPATIHYWEDESTKRSFLVTEPVAGETLDAMWPRLTEAQRWRVAREVAAHCANLQDEHETPQMQSLSGGMVSDDFWAWPAIGPLPVSSARKLFAPLTIDDYFLFAHGDLAPANIILQPDGELAGIVNWEHAGFVPRCWVAIRAGLADMALKSTVREERWDWVVKLREMLAMRGIHAETPEEEIAFRDKMSGNPTEECAPM